MQNEESRGGPRDIVERTFDFGVRVVKLCSLLMERSGVGRILGQQLLRSGTSIGANVEEAQAGQSRADFITKMTIAQKEARETLYWLRLLAAAEVIEASRLAALRSESDEISRILATIVLKTKQGA
jgi:four helix bundle protein